MIRYTVHYSGTVQGVGFRATTRHIAQRFAVCGYVRNLPDGRVLLVAEGEQAELDKFLAAIQQRMGENVDGREVQRGDAGGEFGQPGVDSLVVRY